MNLNVPFTPIRGTEQEIFSSNNKIEGGVYFAYDTKRIFYGHKENDIINLIPMGGNSGIYYGTYTNLEETNDNPFFFDLQHLDHEDSPGLLKLNKGDLILNIPNGVFYKVTEVRAVGEDLRYSTERLTVAGSGGGGSGGGTSLISGTLTAYNIEGLSGSYILTGSTVKIPFTFSAIYNTGKPFDGNVIISVIRPGSDSYSLDNVIRTETNTWKKTYKYNEQETMTVELDISSLFPPLNRPITTSEAISVEVAADFGDSITISKSRTVSIFVVSVSSTWESMTQNNIILYNFGEDDFSTKYKFYGSGIEYYAALYLNNEWIARTEVLTASAAMPDHTMTINRDIFVEQGYESGFYNARLDFYARSTGTEEFSLVGKHEGYLVLWSSEEDAKIIMGTSFNSTTVKQYDNISIPLFLYYTGQGALPTLSFSTPTGTVSKSDWINSSWIKFNYSFQNAGEQEFNIVCGKTSLIISLMVIEEEIGLLGTEVDNYGFKFLPNSFIDNSQILNWVYDNLGDNANFSFSESFDWINGGLQSHTAEDGSLYFSFKI